MSDFHDPTLPGLSVALDLDAVLELLREALPECKDRVQLLGGSIVDVRYQLEGPCWILYRLKVRKDGGRSCHQFLSAQLLRAGDEPPAPPADLVARYEASRASVLSTPVAYVPRAHMMAYAFPLDASLPWLFQAVDPGAMRRQLNRLWAPRNVRVRQVLIRPLGYTPQARAAFLYEVLCESKDTGVPELRRLIGKMHAKKTAARLFAGSWALWRAAGSKMNLAPPVGYIASAGLTLQEHVRGERLGGLAATPGFVRWVRKTARMVAAMHGLSVPLTTRRKPADEAEVVHRWAGVLAAIRPELGRRVERLRDRLASELEARTLPMAPVHGDFHHTNVLVQDDDVVIIDLDEMAYGDPMLDVGRFLASLRIPALRACGSLGGLSKAGDVFLSEYLSRAPGDEKRVRLFEAASLVTAAASSFRIQRPMWKEEIGMLLDEAERVLQGAGPASLPRPAKQLPPPRPVEDPSLWVRDGIYMQAALDPHIRKAYGAEVTRCSVVAGPRLERGDRVRYNLRGRRHGEKWAVTLQGVAWREHGGKGFFQRLEALRAAADGAGDVPLFPRPIAYLRPILLLVWEVPCGVRFSSLLGSSEALEAAAKVARAFAALHRTPVALDSRRSLETEIQALRRRVERMREVRPGVFHRVVPLLEEVERRTRAVPEKVAPIVRTLHPHHILLDDRVILAKLEDVTLAHPLLDVGDFLARLTLMGLGRGSAEAFAPVAERFRESYLAAASEAEARANDGATKNSLSVFEAGALLRLACAQAKAGAEEEVLQRLLERAAERLTV